MNFTPFDPEEVERNERPSDYNEKKQDEHDDIQWTIEANIKCILDYCNEASPLQREIVLNAIKLIELAAFKRGYEQASDHLNKIMDKLK